MTLSDPKRRDAKVNFFFFGGGIEGGFGHPWPSGQTSQAAIIEPRHVTTEACLNGENITTMHYHNAVMPRKQITGSTVSFAFRHILAPHCKDSDSR